jgi:hypothetical protein
MIRQHRALGAICVAKDVAAVVHASKLAGTLAMCGTSSQYRVTTAGGQCGGRHGMTLHYPGTTPDVRDTEKTDPIELAF